MDQVNFANALNATFGPEFCFVTDRGTLRFTSEGKTLELDAYGNVSAPAAPPAPATEA